VQFTFPRVFKLVLDTPVPYAVSVHCIMLPPQVNWYAVLGNHDYGDKIDPAEDSCAANTLDACPEGCCYSSVWQVRAAAAAAAPAAAAAAAAAADCQCRVVIPQMQ
jgi:hypothetical protein